MKPNTLQSRNLNHYLMRFAFLPLRRQFQPFNVFVGSWPTQVGSISRISAGTWWVLLSIANPGQKTNNNCLQKGCLLFGDGLSSAEFGRW